jgi:hypothetical protein
MEKIHVSREQTKITSNIASSWCMVMYSSNPGVDQGPVWGPSSDARVFPRAGYGKALVIPGKENEVST